MKVTFRGKPLIPSKYLEAADLQGKRVAVVIESIKSAKMPARDNSSDSDEVKPLFSLQGKDKGWILNTTNLELIADVYGWEAEKWIGKTVVIYAAKVKAFGEWHQAIRVDGDATLERSKQQGKPAPVRPSADEPAHDEATGEVTDGAEASA